MIRHSVMKDKKRFREAVQTIASKLGQGLSELEIVTDLKESYQESEISTLILWSKKNVFSPLFVKLIKYQLIFIGLLLMIKAYVIIPQLRNLDFSTTGIVLIGLIGPTPLIVAAILTRRPKKVNYLLIFFYCLWIVNKMISTEFSTLHGLSAVTFVTSALLVIAVTITSFKLLRLTEDGPIRVQKILSEIEAEKTSS